MEASKQPDVTATGKPTFDEIMNQSIFSLKDWDVIYNESPSESSEERSKKPSAWLEKYAPLLLPTEPCSVFLPLCGKTPDLRWFYDRGNTVVGLEGIKTPVQQFFQSQNLEYETQPLDNGGTLFKTKDERLKVYVCDVMNITSQVLGKFDLVYDYGAYTAIHPDCRQGYVSLIRSVLKDDFKLFVEFCHGAPDSACGLPTSIPIKTMKTEWGTDMKLQFLETTDIAKEWEVESFYDSFVLLSSYNCHKSQNEESKIKILENIMKLPTIKEPIRVFMPSCSSMHDLMWFYNRGNTVIGIIEIDEAAQRFLKESKIVNLQFTKLDTMFSTLYKSSDDRLQIHVCNLLKLPEQELEACDLIYDTDTYMKLPDDEREKYVSLLNKAAKTQSMVVIRVFHDASDISPNLPRNTDLKQLKKEWGNAGNINFLETNDVSASWKLQTYFESIVSIPINES